MPKDFKGQDAGTEFQGPGLDMKRFRIAFSFAGEKRDFVAKVAAILAQRFGEDKILYDKYHEAEFARYDLGIYLPKLYRDESDLVVAVICPNYDKKLWTGWEWMAIYSQLSKKEGSKIMLSRFEYAHVEGLFDAAAFVELDHKTPEQAATLILERLALNEGKPKDHYTKTATSGQPVLRTSTPNNLPRLQYSFGHEAGLEKIGVRKRVFISYSRLEPDERVAEQLYEALRGSHDVFYDRLIEPGEVWGQRIEQELHAADYFVVLLSEKSITQEGVQGEIEIACEMSKQNAGKPLVIPVRVRYEKRLPYDLFMRLRRIQHFNWSDDADTRLIADRLRPTV